MEFDYFRSIYHGDGCPGQDGPYPWQVDQQEIDTAAGESIGDLYYPEPTPPVFVSVPSNIPLDAAGMPDVT